MTVNLAKGWKVALRNEIEKPYFKELMNRLDYTYQNGSPSVFPSNEQIFSAFQLCDLQDVKVVILGQDPYPTKGFAHGLSFSVEENVRKIPGSLRNIFKELQADLGLQHAAILNLERWAQQGVFLLNTILTVEEGKPGSHSNLGWEQFTDKIFEILNYSSINTVYILWGSQAQSKKKFIDPSRNLIIESVHPSPLSAYRGFFGSKPFSRTNTYLMQHGKAPINW